MRRAIVLALASVAALASGCASRAVGESSSGDDGLPNVTHEAPGVVPIPSAAPASSEPARIDATSSRDLAALLPFAQVTCRKDAFCTDFEEASPLARWTNSVATAGTVDFAGPSSSLGAKALRAVTTGSGSAAYLTLAGPAVGQTWVGSLSFSLRVDAIPTTVIGGPEIAVIDANGAVTRVGFSIRPEGLAVHQHFDACSGPSCATRSDLVSDIHAGEWRRVSVALETSGVGTGPQFGRIEVTVDDPGDLIALPLMVTPFDGKAEVHAGITVADTAPATLRIDDLVFFTH